MPRAPTYTPQIDTINPAGQRFRAVDDGGGVAGGIAAGMQSAAGAVDQFVDARAQQITQRNERLTRKRALEYRQEAAALAQQYALEEGENAETKRPEYEAQLKALGDKYRDSFEDKQASRMMGEQVDPYEAEIVVKMNGHASQQADILYEATMGGELVEAQQNAMASLDNPEAHAGFIADVRSVIAEQAQHHGWSTEVKDQKLRAALSDVHYGALSGMLSQPDADLDLVVDYFAANEDEMTSAHRNAVASAVQGPLETRMAHNDFLTITSGVLSSAEGDGGGGGATDAASAQRQMPVDQSLGSTTDDFAEHQQRGSAGWDFAAPAGSSIKPAADGEVIEAGTGKTGGNFIRIKHADGTVSSYMHMENRPQFAVGDRVTRATVIGTVGSTGRASGPHLHMEVKDRSGKQIDPQAWLNGASPIGSPDDPREWDAGAIRASIDQRVESGEWTFERGERAWAFAQTRINRDKALIAQGEQQAHEDAAAWVLANRDSFTDYEQMPLSIRERLGPTQALAWANTADANKKALQGGGVKANGPDAVRLSIKAVEDPNGFLEENIAEYAGKITAAEFEELAKRQSTMRQKREAWTPHSGVRSAFTRMSQLDGETYTPQAKADVLTLMLERAYEMQEQGGGKPLTQAQFNEAYRYATEEVATKTAFLGIPTGSSTNQRFKVDNEVERAEGVVSETEKIRDERRRRTEVIRRWRAEFPGEPDPTEEQMQALLPLVL